VRLLRISSFDRRPSTGRHVARHVPPLPFGRSLQKRRGRVRVRQAVLLRWKRLVLHESREQIVGNLDQQARILNTPGPIARDGVVAEEGAEEGARQRTRGVAVARDVHGREHAFGEVRRNDSAE